MAENDVQIPPPSAPAADVPAARSPIAAAPSGCFRWGLVGCLFLSVLAIVGLVLFMRRAPELLDKLLTGPAERVLSSTGPEVPPQMKDAYRKASERFVEGAKAGRVRSDAISGVQRKTLEALSDSRVSAEEIRDLTAALEAAAR